MLKKTKELADKEYSLLPLNLQLFAEGDGDPGGGDGNDGNKTFTQDELNSLIEGEKAKAKKSANKQILEELGLENMDALKSIITKQKEADDKKKTDLEKLQEQLNTLTKENTSANARAKETLKIADFKVKAVGKGLDVKQIEAALKLAKLEDLEIKDDGSIDGTDTLIDGLIKEYPFLKGSGNGNAGAGAGGNPGGGDDKGKLGIGQRLAERKKDAAVKQNENPYFK